MRLLFLFLFISINVSAQSDTTYSSIDKIALDIPHVSTRNTGEIANYFNSKFTQSEDKVRAIFVWLGTESRHIILSWLQ